MSLTLQATAWRIVNERQALRAEVWRIGDGAYEVFIPDGTVYAAEWAELSSLILKAMGETE